MFFEIDDPVIRSYDFLKDVGTLYNSFINLLNENEAIVDSLSMQLVLTKVISSLKIIIFKKLKILLTKKKNKNFAVPSNVLANLIELRIEIKLR